MVNKISFYETSCHISGTAVCINMVWAILGIIFQNENNRFFPDGTLAQVFNEHAYCMVVVGYMRKWCGFAFSQSLCVVIDESEGTKLGYGIDGKQ
jgi:hypothetical protein